MKFYLIEAVDPEVRKARLDKLTATSIKLRRSADKIRQKAAAKYGRTGKEMTLRGQFKKPQSTAMAARQKAFLALSGAARTRSTKADRIHNLVRRVKWKNKPDKSYSPYSPYTASKDGNRGYDRKQRERGSRGFAKTFAKQYVKLKLKSAK